MENLRSGPMFGGNSTAMKKLEAPVEAQLEVVLKLVCNGQAIDWIVKSLRIGANAALGHIAAGNGASWACRKSLIVGKR